MTYLAIETLGNLSEIIPTENNRFGSKSKMFVIYTFLLDSISLNRLVGHGQSKILAMLFDLSKI